MTPSASHTCAQCGRELPDLSLGNRCPNCLLQLALTPPPEEFLAGTPVLPPDHAVAERRFFASYELLGEISRGGMGVVYRARQFNPDREVALKMIHPAGRATPTARLRFEVEVAAVARLHHPRIVSLYESGEHEGVCYFSMRLVNGAGLDELLAHCKLPPEPDARVDLLIKVAEAVHYAHQRGILHRDLKPSNILVDTDGEPCIADFGLAKIQESDAGLTRDKSVLGSPSYMAPEQADGKAGEVTTAADVYSLGAILHELLSGAPPFLGKTPLDTLRQVLEQPPPPLRKLCPGLSRDLESICLKALEKEPSRRYASALELAEDLKRWRRGEAVRARPVQPWEHAWRWCRRRPAFAALILVSVVSLVALAIGSTLAAGSLKRAGEETRGLLRRLQHEKAETFLSRGDTAKGLAVLAYLVREDPTDDVAGTRLMSALGQRALPVPLVKPWIGGGETLAVGFSVDGKFSHAIVRNGGFRRLELATGRTLDADWSGSNETLLSADFHPRGTLAATVHPDGPVRLRRTAQPGGAPANLPHETPVKLLAFGADENLLATVDHQNNVRWWRSGIAVVGAAEDGGWTAERVALPPGEAIQAVAFSPDGRWFAAAAESGRLFVLPVDDATAEIREHQLQGGAQRIAFDAESRRLAAASAWNTVVVWTFQDRDEPILQMELPVSATDLAFSPDGRFLAAAGWSPLHRAFVWDTADGAAVEAELVHNSHVTSVKFSPDSRELITLGHDNTARRWSTRTWRPTGEPLVHVSTPLRVAFAPGGGQLVTGSFSGVVWWSLAATPGEPRLLRQDAEVLRAAYSPGGETLATGAADGSVHLWDWREGSLRTAFQAGNEAVLFLRHGPSGRTLVTFGQSGVVRLWDANTGRPTGPPLHHDTPVYGAHFSPDETRLLTAGTDGVARVWDVAAGEQALPPMDHGAPLYGARFSPDGVIVSFGRNDVLRLWNGATGASLGKPLSHGGWVNHVDFSPDGALLVATGLNERVTLWETATGAYRGEPVRHQNKVTMAVFSPDGSRLATASTDATAQVVDLREAEPTPVVIPHAAGVVSVAFSPDGRRLLTLSQGGLARLWDPGSGLPLSEEFELELPASLALFNHDGSDVLTLHRHGVALWRLPRYRAGNGAALATFAELVGRMKMTASGGFIVSPVNEWDALEEPPDPAGLLYPDAPVKSSD